MTVQQMKAFQLVTGAIIDSVRDSEPVGLPGGHLYAVLMAQGCTLEQFERIMGLLVDGGMLRKSGDVYHIKGAK